MRFLVDAQLPPGLSSDLQALGHDALHVNDVLPGAVPDNRIAEFAISEQRVLITKDDDFAFRRDSDQLCVVWLRIGNATNRALIAWLEPRWPQIEQALVEGERLIEVR